MRLSDHRKILRGETKLVGIKRHTTLPHEIRIYQLHQLLKRLYLAIHLLPRRSERGREYAAKPIGHRHEKQLLLMITIRILLLLLLLLLLLFPYLLPKFFSFTFFSRYLRVSSLILRLRQAHQKGEISLWDEEEEQRKEILHLFSTFHSPFVETLVSLKDEEGEE